MKYLLTTVGSSIALACLVPGLTHPMGAQALAAQRVQYTSSLYLKPAGRYETRTFWVPGNRSECRAIVRAHPEMRLRACSLSVSIEYLGRGAQPFVTGGGLLASPHVKTGYASITLCLSGPSLGGLADCNRTIGHCLPGGSSTHLPPCYPAWNARVSTMFQYDGKEVRRIWLDPSIMAAYGFTLRSSGSFSLPKSSRGRGHIVVGESLILTGTIPLTRGIHTRHMPRMDIFPDGSIRYSAH